MSYCSVLWIPFRPDPGLFDQVESGSGIILPDPDLTARQENLYNYLQSFLQMVLFRL